MTFDPRKVRGRKSCQGYVDHSSTSSEHLSHPFILHRRPPVPYLSLVQHRHQECMRYKGLMQTPPVCASVTIGKVGVEKRGDPPAPRSQPLLPLLTQGPALDCDCTRQCAVLLVYSILHFSRYWAVFLMITKCCVNVSEKTALNKHIEKCLPDTEIGVGS